ncbi:hypothetical protein KKC87_00765 [Patescibacteria group bacterium]|nr:hypothetical protein [Patescibacteria group bacterium]
MLQWISKNQRLFLKTATRLSILVVAVFAFIFLYANLVLSQSAEPISIADPNSELAQGLQVIEEPLGLPTTDIRLIVANVIRAALGLVGIVMVVLIIYAGFLWMTAGGNEEQITRAKKMIINAVIGLAIILSAYSIVLFAMRLLGIGTGAGGPPTGPYAVGTNVANFRGSGALGIAIKDHYPERDQTGVARNTKIIISFSRPILASSLITDTNGNGILGDCTEPARGQSLDWKVNCDALILNDDHINISRELVQDGQTVFQPISGAAILASYTTDAENNPKLGTIVIRPYDYLGSDVEETKYLVRVGNQIRLDDSARDNPFIFDAMRVGRANEKYYDWKFACSTELDEKPPHVVGVYPKNNTESPKNTAIQIQFSEAMNPVGMQGVFKDGSETYYVNSENEGSSYIYLRKSESAMPQGSFKLLNGYKTLEFASTFACGVNDCGNNIYCLPVCDSVGANCNSDLYEIILKAGVTIDDVRWEALPFSGITDVSGNALDGNNNSTIDHAAPGIANQNFDNYFWNFTLKNEVAKAPLFLVDVVPGLDAENIQPDQPWQMTFSNRLLADSAYSGVSIEEKPPQDVPLWKVPRVEYSESSNTSTISMRHGKFLDGLRQYYFPIVTSDIVDVNFNCFYPGKGPKVKAVSPSVVSPQCSADDTNCCDVNAGSAFCCNGAVGAGTNSSSTCLDSFLE